MKSSLSVFALMSIALIAGCGHTSDNEIISETQQIYNQIRAKYTGILSAQDSNDIIDEARSYGSSHRLKVSQWSSMSGILNDLIGSEYGAIVEGAPLRKTMYFLESDLEFIDHRISLLDARLLSSTTLAKNMNDLHVDLSYALKVIRSSKDAQKEAQFVESSRLQLKQVKALENQNALLEKQLKQNTELKRLKYSSAQPECIEEYEEKVVYTKPRHKPQEEVVINVGKSKSSKSIPHIVI